MVRSKNGPHQLTYRQAERTFGLVADALATDDPDGAPAEALGRACDDLLEAWSAVWLRVMVDAAGSADA